MTINRKICPAGLKNNPNKNLTAIKHITIHCTGNYSASATAKSHADYVYGGSGGAQTSWHYTIDGKEIWQHFEDSRSCWHAGDGTDGPGNTTSIALEICVNDKAAFKKACENAAWLTAGLLKKHGLGVDKIVQHNNWSGKNCPAELRSGAWGVTWAGFLEMVKKELAPVPVPAPSNTAPVAPSTPAPPAPAVGMYRVRKTWADAASQKGAFILLANAKKCADENPGFSVFDSKGAAVYSGKTSAPAVNNPSQPPSSSVPPASSSTPPSDVIKEGSLVTIKPGTKSYYPGGPKIPAWVISDFSHRVTQVTLNGKPVAKGGKACVLLGKKASKKTGKESAGVNTWVDKDSLKMA